MGEDSKDTRALARTRPGAINPTRRTDPSITPRAWTQPDPLLSAIAAHAEHGEDATGDRTYGMYGARPTS